jgi:copper chaperone
MNLLKFKTSMKCNGCVSNVTPYLHKVEGIKNWKVEFTLPKSTLEVETDFDIADKVIEAVKKAGYTIDRE